ncbi:helix-turn-helix domain-containing protein [Paenibacillus pasadenensis]|uniref:AraC family transcriptional regulator n=1 Tax=Paenibacillus pasadenensis TaxID=217090 RepID=UPI00203EB936|nr:helix-turn-helix domain-containing protein [Paenibacillus pasadenensis]MCM3749616.1 helix-turn-helix domain-containing protein [Paenibacillus pasadenensis]
MKLLQFALPPLPYYVASGYEDHPPGMTHVDRRNIGLFDLLAVEEGELLVTEGDRSYEVKANQALILRPDAHHYGTAPLRERTVCYWLHFKHGGYWTATDKRLPLYRNQRGERGEAVLEETPGAEVAADGRSDGINAPKEAAAKKVPSAEAAGDWDWKMNVRMFAVQLPQYCNLVEPVTTFELLGQITAMQQSGHVGGSMWRQQILFQELLQQISASSDARSTSPSASCASMAAAYLRRHYREDISARQMSDSLNFHSVYIARCMQKEFGCSPKEYLLRYRIDQSKLLLLRTDYPVSRIAGEVGFNQAAYFASCFAKYEGISPRSYRQRFSHA